MSTTFEILPGKNEIPTFRQIICLAEQRLNEFLRTINVNKTVHINVMLNNYNDEKPAMHDILDKPAIWDEDHYAWFYIEDIAGGTDSYYKVNDELHYDIWNEEFKINTRAYFYKELIERQYEIGHLWSFRRSAGQPAIINLTYGLLAAALAELTNGLIYTDDGAWDYTLMPTTPDEFYRFYFKPEVTKSLEDKDWAESCIQLIKDEVSN